MITQQLNKYISHLLLRHELLDLGNVVQLGEVVDHYGLPGPGVANFDVHRDNLFYNNFLNQSEMVMRMCIRAMSMHEDQVTIKLLTTSRYILEVWGALAATICFSSNTRKFIQESLSDNFKPPCCPFC